MVQRRSAPLPRSMSDISERRRAAALYHVDNSSASERLALAADISADIGAADSGRGAAAEDGAPASSEVRAPA
jgi:hypothetical protein